MKLDTSIDPRLIDPRWQYLEWEDFFHPEFGWIPTSPGPGMYGVRAGSKEEYYLANDGVDAVIQAMAKYPKEYDFEIESWSSLPKEENES